MLTRNRPRPRHAFTLIELLVVIAIIAVLLSLLMAGVMAVFGKVPEVQTRTEISQLDAALADFMAAYNLSSPPPSSLVLREDLSYPAGDPSGSFLRKVFGKNLGAGTQVPGTPGTPWVDWNGDGIPNGPWTLEGEQCLVFYLSGIPNTQQMVAGSPPGGLGFSTSNMNPAMSGGSRKGPFFDFKPSRLVSSVGGFMYYVDAWQVQTGPQPYVFYSSGGTSNAYNPADCQRVDVIGPYMTGPGTFTNPNSYQIISAGKDGKFGGGLWNPSGGAVGVGRDDQANFSSKILGVGQQ